MIEITEPELVLRLKGEDVEKFKSLIDQAQRDKLFSFDIDFARDLADQLGIEMYWGVEDTW